MTDTALSPAPSEPAKPSAAPVSPEAGRAPEAGKPAAQTTALGGAPADDKARTSIGGNGGPDWDWRAEVAGDDPKALETLSRMKAPADLWKSYSELRGKLSQAQKPATLKLAEDATPEQVAEYRKAFDVPDVPKEAKDAAYAEAYGIKPPEGYELSEVEKSLLGAFAKKMNASHAPKAFVQKAVAEHFAIQQSLASQAETVAKERARGWQNDLRNEWGVREYDGRMAAANAWVKETFRENPEAFEEMRLAQLPGGGRLGDLPAFIRMIVDNAMAAGHTDRIEANALEAGGKSLAEQRAEINSWRFTDRARFNEAAAPGGRLERIIAAQLNRGEIDENDNPIRKRA